MKPVRLFAAAAVVVAGSLPLAACQKYEADAVVPAAAQVAATEPPVGHQLAPNVMLVVDRSGSMDQDSQSGQRVGDCDAAGQHGLNCKWEELLTAMTGDANPADGFIYKLANSGSSTDKVRLGLVTFSASTTDTSGPDPWQAACSVGVEQQSVAEGTADQIIGALNAVEPAGATPTAATVQFAAGRLAQLPQDGRQNYIVLLTDGAPNCNTDFVITNDNCSEGTDRCDTAGYCQGHSTDGHHPPIGCLDEDGLVNAITAAAGNGSSVKTFVIGFGSSFTTNPAAYETLNRSAVAGGEPRLLPGGGGVADPAFYQASSGADLQAALQAILGVIDSTCNYGLKKAPPSESAVEVKITDASGNVTLLTAPADYTVNGSTVIVNDPYCQQLNDSTPDNPLTLTINSLAGN